MTRETGAKRLLTFDEAAGQLGLKVVTLRVWAAKRRIGVVRLGRSVRIPAAEVDRLIDTGFVPPLRCGD
jgi:excisionase family DNA binding protein